MIGECFVASLATFYSNAPPMALATPGGANGEVEKLVQEFFFLGAVAIFFMGFIDPLLERFKLPRVVGAIGVGLLISLGIELGIEELEFVRDSILIKAIALIGISFMLFEIGLESSIEKLRDSGGDSIRVAVIGVLIPGLLGYLVSYVEDPGAPWLRHLTIGGCLMPTSLAVSMTVLKGRGLTEATIGTIILGMALIDDILVLFMMAIDVSLAGGDPDTSVLDKLWPPVVFMAAAWYFGDWISLGIFRLLRWGLRIFGGDLEKPIYFRGSLVVFFTLACFAMEVSLAPLIGAAIAGLLVNKDHYKRREYTEWMAEKHERALMKRIRAIALLFGVFFFINVGASVNVKVLWDGGTFGLGIVLAVAAICGKLPAGLGVRAPGVDRFAVGLTAGCRGEITTVFISIARDNEIINEQWFGALIWMMVITAILNPIAADRRLQRTEVETPTT